MFPDLLQSILQIRKALLHISDHQEILSMHKRTHFSFPSCNKLLQKLESTGYVSKDTYVRGAVVKVLASQDIRQPHILV